MDDVRHWAYNVLYIYENKEHIINFVFMRRNSIKRMSVSKYYYKRTFNRLRYYAIIRNMSTQKIISKWKGNTILTALVYSYFLSLPLPLLLPRCFLYIRVIICFLLVRNNSPSVSSLSLGTTSLSNRVITTCICSRLSEGSWSFSVGVSEEAFDTLEKLRF